MPLFMVIERFSDVDAVGERFREHGRMLPEGVVVHASWIEPDGGRCFQIMEARDAGELEPWMRRWEDLVAFEVVPVLTSSEFWSSR